MDYNDLRQTPVVAIISLSLVAMGFLVSNPYVAGAKMHYCTPSNVRITNTISQEGRARPEVVTTELIGVVANIRPRDDLGRELASEDISYVRCQRLGS